MLWQDIPQHNVAQHAGQYGADQHAKLCLIEQDLVGLPEGQVGNEKRDGKSDTAQQRHACHILPVHPLRQCRHTAAYGQPGEQVDADGLAQHQTDDDGIGHRTCMFKAQVAFDLVEMKKENEENQNEAGKELSDEATETLTNEPGDEATETPTNESGDEVTNGLIHKSTDDSIT